MLTKEDIQNIQDIVNGAINSFAVVINQGFSEQQKYIDGKIDNLNDKVNNLDRKINYLDHKIDKLRDELNHKIDKLQDDYQKTLESNERIATEIKDMRQEQVMIIGGRERVDDTLLDHDDKIKDHEGRITIMETCSPVGARVV